MRLTTITAVTDDGTFSVPVDYDLADDLEACGLILEPGRNYTYRTDDEVFDRLVMVLCDRVPGDGEFVSVTAA